MPDPVNPEANQQPGGSGSESPAPSPANNPGQSPDPQVVDWEGRYKGAMRVLNQKTQELTSLQEQLTGANNTVQSLQTQLQNGQAQWDATRQGLEQQVATITGERDQAQQTATELQAYQVKMQALAEFPELFPLADSIPNMDNPETMKEYLTGLQKNVDQVAEQKAQRLTAGLTPGATNPAQQTGYKYTTQEEWQNAMNQAAGGEEFQKISDAYLQWVQQGGGQ
jgi:chromosome segregation ATPase